MGRSQLCYLEENKPLLEIIEQYKLSDQEVEKAMEFVEGTS